MKYKTNNPYPEIKVNKINEAYGLMMLDNVGGINSETSAVAKYVYNHTIINNEFPELKKIFLDISIVEMHHLDIFMKLSLKLGVDPRWWSCQDEQCSYWSPAYLNYPTSINDIIQSAIKDEYQAIDKYMYQASIITDPNIIAILMRIIEDEKLHIKILKGWKPN